MFYEKKNYKPKTLSLFNNFNIIKKHLHMFSICKNSNEISSYPAYATYALDNRLESSAISNFFLKNIHPHTIPKNYARISNNSIEYLFDIKEIDLTRAKI